MTRCGMVLMSAIMVLIGTARESQAQGMAFRPIDTNKYVVQPTDTATNIVSGTTRGLTRSIASAIEKNGIVRTINNLFGKEATPTPNQPGLSPLPLPGTYPSTRYPSPLVPALPTYQTFGSTPNVR